MSSITIDPGNSINANCVGWWPMDEGSGATVADVSGNGNDGTLMGSATWGSWGSDNAVILDGTSGGYVEVGADATLNVTTDMTACIWARRTSGSINGAMFHKGALTGGYGDWCVVYDNSYTIYPDFRIDYGNAGPYLGTGTITDNAWHFIAVTYDSTDMSIYVDGALVTSGAYSTAIPTSATPLNIGIYYDVPYAHVGELANARLWSRCLDATEIGDIYADPFFGELVAGPPADPPTPATAPLSSDRLYNRSLTRIFRRGETR